MTIQFNSFNNENNELIKVSTGLSKKSEANGEQAGKKTLFAGNLNMPADPIAEKREKARKQAMKVVSDAWGADQAIDKNVADRMKTFKEKSEEKFVAEKNLAAAKERMDLKKQEYNVDPESQEQKDLDFILGYKNKMENGGTGWTTVEERMADKKRYDDLINAGLTPYQQDMVDSSDEIKYWQTTYNDAKAAMEDANRDISTIEIERLKTHAMVDAGKQADAIMEAANKEIIGDLVSEAKDNIDEKAEEEKEKIEEKKEEEKEEKKAEAKAAEEEAMQQALIDSAKESTAMAEARAKRDYTPDIDISDFTENQMMQQTQSSINETLDDIKNKMALLDADLMGIQVDEKL